MTKLRRLTAGLAAGVIAVTAGGYVLARESLPGPGVGSVMAALPDRLDAPWPWTPTARQSPPGAAVAVFGGSRPGFRNPLSDNEGSVALVAGSGDRQRVVDIAGDGWLTPGEWLLLSPDGATLAGPAQDGTGLELADLRTGAVRLLPYEGRYAPLAWAPDGAALVAVRYPAGADAGVVGTVQVDSGRFTDLLPVSAAGVARDLYRPEPGYAAAYRRDGTRFAVQVAAEIHVFTAGGPSARLTVPAGQRLAGKGAWTPDGTALGLVSDGGRTSAVTFVDAATGAPLRDRTLPPLTDVTTLRLLGWWPDGSAIVVAYRPEDAAPATFRRAEYHDYPTDFEWVRRIDVLAVAPDGRARRIIETPDQVLALDLADDAVYGGRLRPGAAAPILPVRPVMLAAAAGATALVLALICLALVARRRTYG